MGEKDIGRRLKIVGVAAAAVLAVPGGMAVSNAFAADGGGATTPSSAVPVQSEGTTPPSDDQAPRDRGDGRGDRGDCPGKGDGGGGGSGETGTAYTLQ